MTTISERMEYASASAHDFADAAMVQLFELLGIHERIGDETAAKRHPVLLAALIEAATKTYAVERQHEAAERIADGLREIADAIMRSARALEAMDGPRFTGQPCGFGEPGKGAQS